MTYPIVMTATAFTVTADITNRAVETDGRSERRGLAERATPDPQAMTAFDEHFAGSGRSHDLDSAAVSSALQPPFHRYLPSAPLVWWCVFDRPVACLKSRGTHPK